MGNATDELVAEIAEAVKHLHAAEVILAAEGNVSDALGPDDPMHTTPLGTARRHCGTYALLVARMADYLGEEVRRLSPTKDDG